MKEKYVIFKDDDVGKDFQRLRRWVDIILKNNAKASIGLIGKYMKKSKIKKYLNSLDKERIEVFCHGYTHNHLPFLLIKIIGRNRIYPTEFDRNSYMHNLSLRRYRKAEEKYLDSKTISFGPQGNIWNGSIVDPLVKKDFKIMFSWRKTDHDIFTIPLCDNLKQNSFEEFLKVYEKNKEKRIYTLQFHHADLSDRQFELINDVIDFFKNKEKRVFVNPKDILEISKKDKEILELISPINK